MSYQDALEFAQSKRPIVDPNIFFKKQLQDFEEMILAERKGIVPDAPNFD